VNDAVARYAAAGPAVADLVDLIPESAWDGPGLGDWTVRALVGHTSRAFVTVLEYLDRPVAEEVLTSPLDYVRLARQAAQDPAVRQRGEDAGQALGDHPSTTFRDLAARAARRVQAADPESVIHTLGGGMRVRNYLPTRTFELAVHGLDIAAATGLPLALPDEVLTGAIELAAGAAVSLGSGSPVLRALTGRAPLPEGFSIT
jgi:uncharacterized protein (TIGR03083 family)